MSVILQKLLISHLSLSGSLYFPPISISLGHGYTDVKPLVVLRGVGLRKRRFATETWSLSNTLFTLRQAETRRRDERKVRLSKSEIKWWKRESKRMKKQIKENESKMSLT